VQDAVGSGVPEQPAGAAGSSSLALDR
jgi:hypothetical protein